MEEKVNMQILADFIKAVFYCLIIHFINYSFRLPAVFSILPLMLLLLAYMLFTRHWNNQKRQYAFLIPYVVEYFGYCLYFYNRGHLMPITALGMTAILTAWGVLCIECLTKDKKRNVIGFLALALVAFVSYFGIWKYYSVKAYTLADKLMATQTISVQLGEEADLLSAELNSVFYSRPEVKFSLAELADPASESEKDTAALYAAYKAGLSDANGRYIKALVMEGEALDHKLHETDGK